MVKLPPVPLQPVPPLSDQLPVIVAPTSDSEL
jgi:hypothetical protein